MLPVLYSDAPQNHLCSMCPKPGHCCHEFMLSSDNHNGSFWEEEWPQLAQQRLGERNLPFVPLRLRELTLDKESGKRFGVGVFTCPKLTSAGRCSIYEDRPSTCRDFQAASSPLCCFIKPALVKEAAKPHERE